MTAEEEVVVALAEENNAEAAPAVGEKRKADGEPEGDAVPAGAPDDAPLPPCKTLVEPLVLGPKTFTTSDAVFRYFSGVLAAMTLHQDCNEYEKMVLEPLLRRGHPHAELKMGAGIRAFQARNHPEHPSRCFFVVRSDGSVEDFSYRKCCEALMPDSAPPPLPAFPRANRVTRASAAPPSKRGRGAGRGGAAGRGAARGAGRGGRGAAKGGRGAGRGGRGRGRK